MILNHYSDNVKQTFLEAERKHVSYVHVVRNSRLTHKSHIVLINRLILFYSSCINDELSISLDANTFLSRAIMRSGLMSLVNATARYCWYDLIKINSHAILAARGFRGK
jgi:hypothetical protein